MEEILSSIRRIIEDSDTGAKQTEDVGEQTEGKSASQSDAVKTGRPGAGNAPSVTASPKSLAEIQTEVAGKQAGAAQAQSRAEDRESAPGSLPAAEKAGDSAVEDGGNAGEQPAVAAKDRDSKPAPEPEKSVDDPKSASAAGATEAEWAKELKEGTVGPESKEPSSGAISRPAHEPSSGPILSVEAGRRVAASFEQLSEAFMESRGKAFDSMAREMLRPMLQEWLDENLPTLVEKLVREEIERAARGG